ncbi:MAG: hypothetical protein Q4B00_12655, partial [Eubacteriales bacterium]|nr:hypothetical protein [Eubacteriales bacterium]
MKVTKKILAGLLAASMVVSSATVWAAGSRTNNVTLPEESTGKYVIADDIKETPSYKALAEKAPEVVSLIDEVNAGTADAVSFVESMKEVLADETLSEEAKASVENVISVMEEKNLDFVTGFFDLDLEEDAEVEKNENGNYDVTLAVPSMTDTMTDINLLHYSTVRELWEVIEVEAEN